MEFGILIFIVIGSAVVAILWSIGRGIRLLRRTYTQYGANQTARRILAWNLIEPGLTVPNVLLLIFGRVEYGIYAMGPTGNLLMSSRPFNWLEHYPIAVVLCFWPMILLFMIIPLFAQGSADPTVRWAARKTAQLGLIRMIITIISYSTVGIGMLIGVPLLFWSLKKVRLWNNELLGHYESKRAAAIVGGKSGMLVVPAHQMTSTSDFKVLID